MAHFERKQHRISTRRLFTRPGGRVEIDLWGPMNQLIEPEEEVVVSSSDGATATVTKSTRPISNRRRGYELKALRTGTARIRARTHDGEGRWHEWDWFNFVIRDESSAGTFAPATDRAFIDRMARDGRDACKAAGLPLAAMVACACGETGFGTSSIYKLTGCPFNLQRPWDWKWPDADIFEIPTVNKEGERPKSAPFCVADSLAHAARLWCQWIEHWPNRKAKATLMSVASDARAFAANLFIVGFAAGKRENTEKFAKIIDDHNLLDL